MFRVSRIGRYLALAAIGLVSLFGTIAIAAPTPAGSGFGVLDFDGVMKGYSGSKEATARLREAYDKFNGPISIIQSGIGLSEEDFATYKKLREQPAQDKAQIDKLEAQARTNCDQFQSLEMKQQTGEKLTAEEQKQYDTLKKQIYAVNAQANELQQQAQQELSAEHERLLGIILGAVDDAVSKVAKDQKLTAVINKNVQSGNEVLKFVYWNDKSIDVTDKVLKILNENFKPTMLDATPNVKQDAKPDTKK